VIDQIKKRLDNGFAPFALRLSDGRCLAVAHRDFIALSPKVVVGDWRGSLAVTINPLHIVSVDDAGSRALTALRLTTGAPGMSVFM